MVLRDASGDDPEDDNGPATIGIMQVCRHPCCLPKHSVTGHLRGQAMIAAGGTMMAICVLHVIERWRRRGVAGSMLRAALRWRADLEEAKPAGDRGALLLFLAPKHCEAGCQAMAAKLECRHLYDQRWLQLPRVR